MKKSSMEFLSLSEKLAKLQMSHLQILCISNPIFHSIVMHTYDYEIKGEKKREGLRLSLFFLFFKRPH